MPRENVHENNRTHDLIAAAIIAFYCLLHFVLRVLISSSMELDESEQFLQVTAPYRSPQPLLYSIMVKTVSLLSGQTFISIVVVKYVTIFTFYLCFYRLARTYWNARESLVITASLTIFPTYSYEFVRDLSHSILASVFAVIAALYYIKMLSSKSVKLLPVLLVSLCLGMLSKYVFIFFLAALACSDIIVKKRWKAMGRMGKLLVILFLVLSTILFIVLIGSGELPFFSKIVEITRQGKLDLGAPLRVSRLLLKGFMEILIFGAAFLIFFYGQTSLRIGREFPQAVFFRVLAGMATFIPLATILLLRLGHFRARWLAPVMFTIPLAFFSLVDMEKNRKRLNLFGYCCLALAVTILFIRATVGLFPDVIGKKERVHIPFEAASAELSQRLAALRAGNPGDLVMISDRQYLIANMMRWLGMRQYALVDDEKTVMEDATAAAVRKRGGIIVWDASLEGESFPRHFLGNFPGAVLLEPVRVPYIRSDEAFTMGVAIVPGDSHGP